MSVNWERTVSSTSGAGETISTRKRMKLDPYPVPRKIIYSEWIKYLSVRAKTVKFVD